MANYISFVGKIRKIKDGYSEQEFAGGLVKRRLRFQVLCGGSVQWLEVNALVWKDEKKNKVYTLKSVEGAPINWINSSLPELPYVRLYTKCEGNWFSNVLPGRSR